MKTKKIQHGIYLLALIAINALLAALPAIAAEESRISNVNFSDLTTLLLKLAQWVFGIASLVFVIIAVQRGLEIASTSAGPNGKSVVMDKLGRLLIGAFVCFGSWLLVAVIKGVLQL